MNFYTQDKKILFDKAFSEIYVREGCIEVEKMDGTTTVLGCYFTNRSAYSEMEKILFAYIHGDNIYEMP